MRTSPPHIVYRMDLTDADGPWPRSPRLPAIGDVRAHADHNNEFYWRCPLILGRTRYLGLALSDRSILAAGLASRPSQEEAGPAAEFVFPAELSWDEPVALGKALRQFLRQNRFSASRTVVGVPVARPTAAREGGSASAPGRRGAYACSARRAGFPLRPRTGLRLRRADRPGGASQGAPGRHAQRYMDAIAAIADEAGLSRWPQ